MISLYFDLSLNKISLKRGRPYSESFQIKCELYALILLIIPILKLTNINVDIGIIIKSNILRLVQNAKKGLLRDPRAHQNSLTR